MSFNKRFLPDLAELKSMRNKFNTDKEFVNWVTKKADVIFGPSESMDYIRELNEKIYLEDGKGSSGPGFGY